ncbi:stage II sporulation protein M [Clostridium tyrobutyricum]|jgi:stage II sporulation protein M|uniref:Stage II sporulation protein M (SpoIIM) n=1 Tax=Clostridium tyrobutyricum DIVETGP TaxID=1408889 RepID=W6N1V9_CLOTY|nr:stage II sporulation protein M [Clostridium tyrobutyricum]AND85176.1 stage II sporulation protein M [Clostridium tyrobutyricum]ANP69735.1 stage II sporulation protein M [Clostridium tyrobutyricum]MBR9646935.1 stage II sporulation protein M [Clostridium tyrobutyricum]MBV4415195.1 stage II sporulation protein M [Clostridium tyrobutyricum]MBV4420866.1 stage II sporulation protein M [Clostridium tyrobutyricum]
MLNGKVTELINKHVQDNFWLYVISLLCVCTGIVLGVYSVRYMGGFEKSDLLSYLNSFKNSIDNSSINYKSIFMETLKINVPMLVAIWFLGLTMIGIPVILIIDVLKGFTIGFASSFIIGEMGMKGIWFDLLGIFPQNIIYIPCIIFSSVLAMEFSLTMFRDRSNNQWKSHILLKLTSYSITFVFVIGIMCIGFILEVYLTPNMVKLIVLNGTALL